MNIIDAAIIAQVAHAAQTDKLGRPYMVHVRAVVRAVQVAHPNDRTAAVVAYLHDVVEDSDVTSWGIRAGFGDEVADAVDALTRRPGEVYLTYIRRVAENPLARRVKLADNAVNLLDVPSESLRDRYERARIILMSAE